MKILITFLLTFFQFGCATRTQYHLQTEDGGYSDSRLNDKLMIARFAGNANTNSDDASFLSQFRALEVCNEQGYKFLRVAGQENKSISQTVQKTSSYTTQSPTYITGNTNSTSNYGYGQTNTNTNFNATITGGNKNNISRSWNETYIYPAFDTYFSCTNQPFLTKVTLKEITAEDMKPYVKDLFGAIQIENIAEDSPNKKTLKNGDFIIAVDGNRIKNQSDFIVAVEGSGNKNKISTKIIRDGKTMSVSLKAIDGSEVFFGENEKMLNIACHSSDLKDRAICAGRAPASHEKKSGLNCLSSIKDNGEIVTKCK